MSNIPTLPDDGHDDMARQQSQRTTDEDRSADLGVEKEDIEAEEQADVDRLDKIDSALTENGGP